MPIVWPETSFGKPDAGLNASPDPSSVPVKMDSGEYRQRHDRRGRREVFQIVVRLQSARMAMFSAWFKHKIGHGKEFFEMDLPDGQGGFTTRTVRLTKSAYKAVIVQLPLLWSVSFEVESFS